MSSGRRMSNDSSSSASVSDDIHAFAEEEEVNVSVLKAELMAEFKRGMEAELNDMRESVIAMREELSRLRVERDEAVSEAEKLRELLQSKAQEGVNQTNARTPPRKIAKVSTATCNLMSANSNEFPELPAKPGPSSKPTSQVNSSANSVPASSSASTSKAASLRPSLGASKAGAANVGVKKTMQAIDTDIFKVRRVLSDAAILNFSVKQTSKKGPVKIVLTSVAEVTAAKNALASAKISFHEFKTPDERMKCFIIRGLVGATEQELPFIKDELCQLGLPGNIQLSLHVTGYMKANPNKNISAPVKLVVPPNFDDKLLLQIKYINHMAVRFELFKSKSVMQCKNCQRFGHSASGCQHEHRCVKCGLNHYRDSCPRTLDPTVTLRCCNCEGEHTANNVNSCPYFLKRYGKPAAVPVLPANKPSTTTTSRPAPVMTQSGVSYARVASSNRQPSSDNRPNANNNNNKSDNNSYNNIFSDAISMISTQLGQIMVKLEEHSLLMSKHDKLIKILMSNACNE